MSTTLEPADLTAATVGTTGSIDLTQVTGPGGISYAIGGQATLRLHNESNCGLRCMFDNSGQSFNLPAGGWSDCFPKSSDNALNFTVLYTLSGPGVTLLLSTYYYPGEPVPAQTTLGNSPIGGGNVGTNFSELTNTGNNPGTNIINVQPNDATAPTWTADNSGGLTIKADNAGVLTTLLQLVAGASPEVILAAATILTQVAGNLQIAGQVAVQSSPNSGTALNVTTNSDSQIGLVVAAKDSTQASDLFRASISTSTHVFAIAANGSAHMDAGKLKTDGAGNLLFSNNNQLQWSDSTGTVQNLLFLDSANNTNVGAPSLKAIQFLNGLALMALINNVGLYVQGGTLSLGSSLTNEPVTLANGAIVSTFFSSVTVTNLAAVTGIIMAVPGQTDGTLLSVVNNGAGSITFAAQATSNVKGGAGVVIGAGNTALFIFSPVDNLWHRIVAN